MVKPLPEHEIHLYFINISEKYQPEYYLGDLSAAEITQADGFITDELKRLFVIRRGLLRNLLQSYTGLTAAEIHFKHNAYGKPHLHPAQNSAAFYFNISHTDSMMLIGITQHREIGVDIESMKPDTDYLNIARSFFSTQEYTALSQLPLSEQCAAFYRAWTRKEAYIKALGEGLSCPLNSFSVSLDAQQPAKLLATQRHGDTPAQWQLFDTPYDEHRCGALALQHQGQPCSVKIKKL